MSAVANYNKQNTEYEIQTKIYGDDLTKFNLDLASGNIPDIFFLGQMAPLESYTSKGLFADLYEFMDKDPEIDREDFVESVLNILEKDDKLYAIPESFYVKTILGRVSDVGTTTGWTWDEFYDMMASKPEGTIPLAACALNSTRPHMTADEFFNHLYESSNTYFLDFDKMECYYDTPAFINILETAKQYYPQGVNYDVSEEAYLQGNPVLIMQTLSSFSANQTTEIETRYFGEEMTYIGAPTMDGTGGSGFEFYNLIAISAHSDKKEEAWKCLKYILTEYQHDLIRKVGTGLPINRIALEESAQLGMESTQYPPEGYTDPDGIFHRPPLEKDVQKIYDLIDSITTRSVISRTTAGIWTILLDEIPGYFNGDKTAEETAAIIQNRVSIFMKEME
jgi:ABC-type glycerol-3-phosphate transport system substrate-binding protein